MARCNSPGTMASPIAGMLLPFPSARPVRPKSAPYYQNFVYPQGGLPLLIDVNFADNLQHQLTLYFVDWHHNVRTENVVLVDGNTHNVLNSQQITNFDEGVYLTYKMQGHVQIQVTLVVTSTNLNNNSTPDSVVMAAMFFDPAH
jgi:hypothetical protein